MEAVLMLLAPFAVIAFIIWIIKTVINCATNTPSWQGIIISALLGMLPFYLFLCWLGWMGNKKDRCDY